MGFYIALLFLANALWGSTDVVAKFALSEMTPATLTWMRFTIALLVFSSLYLL
jgi:drug/metabolite transporter (DMT)-like permease